MILSENLAQELRRVNPSKIAVAYIGRNWQSYVNTEVLEQVVVSPTLGSNPRAIAELGKKIGWDNLYFLDNIHSKLYIGASSVMIGSANLSDNGFANNSREEACVVLDKKDDISRANKLFERYREAAKRQYENYEQKQTKLDFLREKWNKAYAQGLLNDDMEYKIRTFDQYSAEIDGMVYVSYCINEDSQYKDLDNMIINDIYAEVHLSPNDINPINQWVLLWVVTQRNTVNRRINPWLTYIHEMYENGCNDEGYENLFIQRASLETPPKPFDETDRCFINSFRSVMNQKKYAPLRGIHDDENHIWQLRDNREITLRFLADLREEYLKNQPH